jgi:hypothetical protein
VNRTSIAWVRGPAGAPGFTIPDHLTKRFWGYVDKNGPTMPNMDTPCWEWTAGRFKSSLGYGQFRLGGKKVRAHRLAWQLDGGANPQGMLVLHRCDNPICCRVSHLFLGTSLDNARDRDRKGRHRTPESFPDRSGENNQAAKLDWNEVRQIRSESDAGESRPSIAKRHGMSLSQVRNIVSGKCWKEVA